MIGKILGLLKKGASHQTELLFEDDFRRPAAAAGISGWPNPEKTAFVEGQALGLKNGGNLDAAKAVGKEIARRLQDNGHKEVVFDRGGYRYHGRIKVLADSAREAGLKF